MSATKVLHLGTALFTRTRISLSPVPLLFPKSLRLPRYISSSAAVTSDGTETLCSSDPHPWPEWVTFVDRLKTKGYFTESPPAETVYNDMGVVKDACLSFARDRYDVFKWVAFLFFYLSIFVSSLTKKALFFIFLTKNYL